MAKMKRASVHTVYGTDAHCDTPRCCRLSVGVAVSRTVSKLFEKLWEPKLHCPTHMLLPMDMLERADGRCKNGSEYTLRFVRMSLNVEQVYYGATSLVEEHRTLQSKRSALLWISADSEMSLMRPTRHSISAKPARLHLSN